MKGKICFSQPIREIRRALYYLLSLPDNPGINQATTDEWKAWLTGRRPY